MESSEEILEGEPIVPIPKAKKRRNMNFREGEKLALLQFVQDHKRQLMGKAGRPGHGDDKVEERKAAAWKQCTMAVNQVGGNNRDWKKVKKQWQALQDKAKKNKGSMERTGGGPKPKTTPAVELAMEVMARESLEGIRGRTSELDPTGQSIPECSQDSSQESEFEPTQSCPSSSKQPTSSKTTTAASRTTTAASAAASMPPNESLAALQQQVTIQQTQLQTLLSQPSSLQRATEIRQLKFQEELLKLEKKKVDLQAQSLEVQKKMLTVMEAAGASSLFNLISEQ